MSALDRLGREVTLEVLHDADSCRELAAKGHRFRTHVDSEVIVHAWEEWGEACVERFNDMFAFAI